MEATRVKRISTLAGITAVSLATLAVAAVLSTPGAAEAQNNEEATPEDETARAVPPALSEILSDLVEEQVITQEQADRIAAEIRDRGVHFGRHGHRFRGPAGLAAKAEIAEILGLTAEELRDALGDGKTLGEIADETGTRQELIEGLVAAGNGRIDAALEAGRITEDEAAELRGRVTERVEDLITRKFPDHGFRGRGFRGPEGSGFGRFGPPDGTDA